MRKFPCVFGNIFQISSFTESTLDILSFPCYTAYMESELSTKGGGEVKNRLEALRKERGIRQEELAKALSVSRQTIGSLENGRYNPSILLAFRIARYFDLPIEEIFLYDEEEDTL